MDRIDELMRRFDRDFTMEETLLGCSTFPLNKSQTKHVSIGISPAAGLLPIVKIWGPYASIFFLAEEWRKFSDLDIGGLTNPISMEGFEIYKTESLWIEQREFKMALSEEAVHTLTNIKELIDCKLNILSECAFKDYFYDLFYTSVKMDENHGMINNIMLLIQPYKYSLLAQLMMEYVYMYNDDVAAKYEKYK